MATSEYKSVKLYTPKAKATYTGLYAYSNKIVKACDMMKRRQKYCNFRTRFNIKIQLVFNKSQENGMVLQNAAKKEKNM